MHMMGEECGDTRGAVRLDRKQRHQDQQGQRHDIMLEGHGDELDAFDRGQHRQRRRNHRVAVE
jgi:hypothetical protein